MISDAHYLIPAAEIAAFRGAQNVHFLNPKAPAAPSRWVI